VFYTRGTFESNELFLYMYARVASRYPDTHIVAVTPKRKKRRATFSRYWKKAHRLGLADAVDIISSYPIRRFFARRDKGQVLVGLRALPRPDVLPDPVAAVRVPNINGPTSVRTMGELEPDVIIQSGAGILKPQIFTLARLATLNLHHGIAPLIKGVSSILWGQYERRPEWIGSTVHVIDEGIDTGAVLAYAKVEPERPGERFPSLYVRASEGGVARLVETLERLEAGETWRLPTPPGESVYRSTLSGWKQLAIEIRLARERRAQRRRDARRPITPARNR